MLSKQDTGEYECFANGETSRVSLTVTGKSEDPVDLVKEKKQEVQDFLVKEVKQELKFVEKKVERKIKVEHNIKKASVLFRSKSEHACLLSEFTCKNRECISKKLVCNGVFDCEDASDEQSCHRMIFEFFKYKLISFINENLILNNYLEKYKNRTKTPRIKKAHKSSKSQSQCVPSKQECKEFMPHCQVCDCNGICIVIKNLIF